MNPAPSFEKINYSVRPAKAAQRHMLVEAIARLARFESVSDYRYIGFGSTFFIDFRLLHQRFGITQMHSIEREVSKLKRFELNRPFRCVNMLYGDSRKMLLDPKIKWEKGPVIAWLDYDEPLDLFKLADCERVLTRALHGSLLLATFDASAKRIKGRRERFKERLGPWLPYEETDQTLDEDRVAELGLDVLTAHADGILADIGGEKTFRPLFRFRYNDGQPMATWGGLVLDTERAAEADDCKFDQLPYVVQRGEDTHHVEIPNLTAVERTLVERDLPNRLSLAKRSLVRHAIPAQEADRLAAVYRYAPRFIETFA